MASEADEYGPIADLYDHVGVYRERPDVAFFVEAEPLLARAGFDVMHL